MQSTEPKRVELLSRHIGIAAIAVAITIAGEGLSVMRVAGQILKNFLRSRNYNPYVLDNYTKRWPKVTLSLPR